MEKKLLKPVLVSNYWRIGATPQSIDAISSISATSLHQSGQKTCHEVVDHHLFQGADGQWHLWGCVRGTCVGRILYHWESPSFLSADWKATGEIIRANPDYGESLDNWRGEEWIQSPYFVSHEGVFYMFYGGHSTGDFPEDEGNWQICLMTSKDGRNWTRHRNSEGRSAVVTGKGWLRDPQVTCFDGLWHMYICGYHDGDWRTQGGVLVSTSKDLITWTEPRLVHSDPRYGENNYKTECPFVVQRGGYYYMFRTAEYYSQQTYVFRSENPFDFGIGDARKHFVCLFPAAATEIYEVDGKEYVSSSHKPGNGEMMARMKWVPDQ